MRAHEIHRKRKGDIIESVARERDREREYREIVLRIEREYRERETESIESFER